MDEKSRVLGSNSHLVAETVGGIIRQIADISPTLLRPAPSAMAGED
jgi:hypothetical protein